MELTDNRTDVALRIDLGRAWLAAEDVARIEPGCVIELDRRVGHNVDVYAGGRLVASGQAVAVDGARVYVADDRGIAVTEDAGATWIVLEVNG